MLAEATRGANSPILVEAHKGDDGGKREYSMMMLAILIIMIIFIFVIFIFAIFAMRKEHRPQTSGQLAEVAAAGLIANQANKPHAHGHDHNAEFGRLYQLTHDSNRDMLKGQAILEKEIALTHANSQATTAQYFYQTQREIEQAKFENYKATVEQAEKTRAEIAEVERVRNLENNISSRVIATLHPNHYMRPPLVTQQHIVAENGGFGC